MAGALLTNQSVFDNIFSENWGSMYACFVSSFLLSPSSTPILI